MKKEPFRLRLARNPSISCIASKHFSLISCYQLTRRAHPQLGSLTPSPWLKKPYMLLLLAQTKGRFRPRLQAAAASSARWPTPSSSQVSTARCFKVRSLANCLRFRSTDLLLCNRQP